MAHPTEKKRFLYKPRHHKIRSCSLIFARLPRLDSCNPWVNQYNTSLKWLWLQDYTTQLPNYLITNHCSTSLSSLKEFTTLSMNLHDRVNKTLSLKDYHQQWIAFPFFYFLFSREFPFYLAFDFLLFLSLLFLLFSPASFFLLQSFFKYFSLPLPRIH